MGFIKCYDTLLMVIEEANDQFGLAWKVNKEKERIMKKNCDQIDDISSEFGGVSYEVDINDETMDITVSLVCTEMTLESPKHKYYWLIQNTKSFGFTNIDNGELLKVTFVFDGIWERAI